MKKIFTYLVLLLSCVGVAYSLFDMVNISALSLRDWIGILSVIVFCFCSVSINNGLTVGSTLSAISHLWKGPDNELSIKRALGTCIFFHLLNIVHYAVQNDKIIQTEILFAYVTLIAAFFMLTMVPDTITKLKDSFKKGSSTSSTTILSSTSKTENSDDITSGN